jgi:hypothetical protein
MTDETKALREEIRAFLAETGMSATYFGKLAVGNSLVVRRLEAGRPIYLSTAERLRAYMAKRRGEKH